jgi:hypothetical protein
MKSEVRVPDLTTILIAILVITILWLIIKLVFKLTMSVFSCGCLLLLMVGALLFFSGTLQILPDF